MSGAHLQVVHIPGSTTPYLNAQRGLFTLIKQSLESFEARPASPAVEQFLQAYAEHTLTAGLVAEPKQILRKLTLPRSEAGLLLRRLYECFVSAEVLFPGLDGLVAGLKEGRRYPLDGVDPVAE